MCGYVPGVGEPETEAASPEAPPLGAGCLLAIDTSIGTSVALRRGDDAIELHSIDERGHTEAIGGLIAGVFEQLGVSPEEVTGVVAGIGPGPFTGLRVGIAAAHAFAIGRGVPVLPLSGHEAVALEALEALVEADARVASFGGAAAGAAGGAPGVRIVQDARRRELFVTDYAGLDEAGLPVRSAGPRLEAREGYRELPHEIWPTRIPALRLVRLASRRLAAGIPFEPDRALYLRAPDVMPAAAPKRVSAQSERMAFDCADSAVTAAAHGAQRGVSA